MVCSVAVDNGKVGDASTMGLDGSSVLMAAASLLDSAEKSS